ncbi:MAG TPA: FoF1 ATP synthase subunit gamma [Patescibacteria group bacterium]|nr:FoF1 ATP synthase subunit gamma [Patescibacteria group bacterium]
MPNKQITTELDLVFGLRSLATAYQEISVMKMREIRNSVLQTRTFMEGLSGVFGNVKSSYRHQIESLAKQKKKEGEVLSFSTLPQNGKEVIVLLSANTKLYGDIIPKTFFRFLEETQKSSAEIVIVGALGKELFDQQEKKKKYTYFELPDNQVTIEDLKRLVQSLIVYQTVRVFYGKFENVITQNPDVTLVSGAQQIEDKNTSSENFRFYFEPSLEKILNFFETQIFAGLFQQTIHENQLARYASRITAMEGALENVHNRIGVLKKREKRFKNSTENKKQLAALSGISLWSRKN